MNPNEFRKALKTLEMGQSIIVLMDKAAPPGTGPATMGFDGRVFKIEPVGALGLQFTRIEHPEEAKL